MFSSHYLLSMLILQEYSSFLGENWRVEFIRTSEEFLRNRKLFASKVIDRKNCVKTQVPGY